MARKGVCGFHPASDHPLCWALWRRKWQPTPVFLPGKSHGLRNLVGYSPWGHKELDTTERLHFTLCSEQPAQLYVACLVSVLPVNVE